MADMAIEVIDMVAEETEKFVSIVVGVWSLAGLRAQNDQSAIMKQQLCWRKRPGRHFGDITCRLQYALWTIANCDTEGVVSSRLRVMGVQVSLHGRVL
ncbi:unnamed protein product [Urochloa humidicola]